MFDPGCISSTANQHSIHSIVTSGLGLRAGIVSVSVRSHYHPNTLCTTIRQVLSSFLPNHCPSRFIPTRRAFSRLVIPPSQTDPFPTTVHCNKLEPARPATTLHTANIHLHTTLNSRLKANTNTPSRGTARPPNLRHSGLPLEHPPFLGQLGASDRHLILPSFKFPRLYKARVNVVAQQVHDHRELIRKQITRRGRGWAEGLLHR